MAGIPHRRNRYPRCLIAALFLFFAASRAQTGSADAACAIRIQSLKDAAPFSALAKDAQTKVLHALGEDIAEMAEIDIASSFSSHAAYRNYFIRHLEFKTVPGNAEEDQLLLIRYHSNTMCGFYENCPVWIVRVTHARAQTMVPWQEELGTSAGGGWAIGVRQPAASQFPELILLTHLSSTQTGLTCYRESKRNYLRVDCSPECARLLEHGGNIESGK